MFTYKGITSRQMGLGISHVINYSSTSRGIEFLEISGRDGDIAIDKGGYSTVLRDISVMLDGRDVSKSVEQISQEIGDWLLTDSGYNEFLWDSDPDFSYRAMFAGPFDTERILSQFGKAILTFRLHPVKYLISEMPERSVSSGANIRNPFNISAKPVLIITGNGDITLTVGSQEIVLRGVDRGIILDSESQTVLGHDRQRTQFDKMYTYPFPVLRPGNTTIAFPENVSVNIVTRIGALVT